MPVDLISLQFFDTVNDCRRIYVDQAVEAIMSKPDLTPDQRNEFLDEVEFRFNRLIIKIFAEVAWSDCVWSQGEGQLAIELLEDLTRTSIPNRKVKTTLEQMLRIASEESWQSVLEPFTLLEELQDQRCLLEAGLMKLANIVAKVDGNVTDETIGQLKNLKWQLHQFLTPPPAPPKNQTVMREIDGVVEEVYDAIQNAIQHGEANVSSQTAQAKPDSSGSDSAAQSKATAEASETSVAMTAEEREEQLALAMEELEVLIGIDAVKSEVKGLINFLKVQSARIAAGLPENQISLHMVFEGNPGTGKTTVARILGRVFGAMGVLEKGHLIETDRSGLVAEFVGQTATKANKIIDSALDGVLFIDEAYSLVGDAKDSFGAEALQILLKRAEDDRDRLIVVMAGYSKEMQTLLQSNPGLSSRFARSFSFPDYSAEELSGIFSILAQKNHYRVSPAVQQKLNVILADSVKAKDEHFGNGRMVRNIFEKAIRNLADRVVNIAELTPELLTTFEPEDIELA